MYNSHHRTRGQSHFHSINGTNSDLQVEDGTPSQQIPNPDKNARRRLMLWTCAGGVLLVGINLAITLS